MAVQGILPPKFTPASHNMAVLSSAWTDFKSELNLYFNASGQKDADDAQKVSLLLYQMGRQYKKVFDNELVFADPDDRKKYKEVTEKFDDYFEPKKLTKSYIVKFQCRKQLANESIAEYITELRRLAKLCDFGNREDKMLSVQISVGVRDKVLGTKISDEDLTLAQIIEKCQTYELRSQCLRDEKTQQEVNAIRRGRGRSRSAWRGRGNNYRGNNYHSQNRGGYGRISSRSRGQSSRGNRGYSGHGRGRAQRRDPVAACGKCGEVHPPRQCRAYGKQCTFCSAFGHFEKYCFKKQVHCVDNNPEPEDDTDYEYETVNMNSLSICAVHTKNNGTEFDPWTILLRTPYDNGKVAVKMKIDTQAQCNTLSKTSFDNLRRHVNLKLLNTRSTITVFGNGTVEPIGRVRFQALVKGRTYTIQCEVVDAIVPNLLGAKDSERLGLVKRVYTTKREHKQEHVKVTDKPKAEARDEQQNVKVSDKPNKTEVRDKPLFDDAFLKKIPNFDKIPKCIMDIIKEFSDRFPDHRVGKIPGEWHLSIDQDYTEGPVSFGSRPIPAAMREMTKAQLDFLEEHDIISKVPKGVPTPWCSQMHVVHKKDGKSVRVCIDPKFLNRALLREYHPIKTLEDVLTKIQGSKCFTVLDANMGFYQLQLDAESQLLTCFQTPWGRYKYQRLPMGIKSAPELYQRAVEEIFQDVDNLENIFDDILLYSANLEDQCRVLRKTLMKARENDLTFRLSKCMFAQSQVDYTGHVLTDEGVTVSPEKVRAILEMPEPRSKEEVRTLLGMATYLAKYLPNFSDITQELREVIKKKTDKNGQEEPFFFDKPQKDAFENLKTALTQTPVMRYYSLTEPIVVSCDASLNGLGAVLLQQDHPVAYASKSLTDTERAYAQIEKELLAIVFACRKFHHLLYGRSDIVIETDHLPLVNIITKPLGQVPMRLQKMLLKLQPYSFKLIGKSGKEIPVADCLSRAPLKNCYYRGLVDDMQDYQVCATEIPSVLAFPQTKLNELKTATANDKQLQKLSTTVVHGWPVARSKLDKDLRQYWDFREEITVYDGILFKGERVIIPKEIQHDVLDLVHSSHQGVVKTKQFARDLVFWKGMNSQIEDVVSKCGLCQENRAQQQKEPMLSTEVPTLPWQYVSTDLFQFEDQWYMVTVDHYSGYIEVDLMENNHSAQVVISKLKHIFATHGIPEILYSDQGSEYTSEEFHKFSEQWCFTVKPYSAKYSQANGMAEKAVQIAKNLLRKATKDGTDLQLALLDYRNTPRDFVLGSPVQRSMGRRTRTRMPTTSTLLKPELITPETVTNRLKQCRSKNKTYYDKQAKPLPPIKEGDSI